MNFTLKPLLLLPIAAFVGCGAAPVSNNRIVSSEAAIRSAREVGAESVPAASLFLKLSEEQLTSAKAMMANGDNLEADLALQRAQADAELALALTRESAASSQAAQIMDQVQQLRGKR